MWKELTQDEKNQIFIQYWGKTVKSTHPNYPKATLIGVNLHYIYMLENNDFCALNYVVNECKLVLKHHVDLTQEELIAIAVVLDIPISSITRCQGYIRDFYENPLLFTWTQKLNHKLIEMGYAVPVYLGHNHWANGKHHSN